jgi:eukaryotic-like serine/threonine-protein kinase
VPEIAAELDVQYVLEGSVRKAGNSLRITAQLIDASNDAHLWSEKYSGTLDDVFDAQEKVSRSIVDALKLKLSPEESRKMAERPIDNVAAYQCYLKANAEFWRFDARLLDSARANLQHALDILGDNALLYATMGAVYFQYANLGVAQEDSVAKAEEYVRKALALDPDIPQAHNILSMIAASFYGNLPECIRQLKLSLAANPNDVDALKFISMMCMFSAGKLAAVAPFMQRLKEINPVDPWNWSLQGELQWMDGQCELALEPLRRFYELEPENSTAGTFYAWCLTEVGKLDEAFSVIDRNAKTMPDNVITKFGILLKAALLKDKEKAFREMTPDFQKTCRRDHQWSYMVALPLALLGAREEALEWLENAVNKGFINYPELERERHLDNLRGDERFKKLLERVKYEWEHFEV